MSSLISDRRIYLTADGRAVEETHKQRASLLVGKGGTLRAPIAAKYAITVGHDGRLVLPETEEEDDEPIQSAPATGPEKVQAFLASLTPYQRRALLTRFNIEDRYSSPSSGALSEDAQIALLIHFLLTEQGNLTLDDIAFVEDIEYLEEPGTVGSGGDEGGPAATDVSTREDTAPEDAPDQPIDTGEQTLADEDGTENEEENPDVTETKTPTEASAADEKAVQGAPENKAVQSAPRNKSLKGALQTKAEQNTNTAEQKQD